MQMGGYGGMKLTVSNEKSTLRAANSVHGAAGSVYERSFQALQKIKKIGDYLLGNATQVMGNVV